MILDLTREAREKRQKGRRHHSTAFIPYALSILEKKRLRSASDEELAFLHRNQQRISVALSQNLKKWASPNGTTR